MENQIQLQLQLHHFCIINYSYNYNYVIGPGSVYYSSECLDVSAFLQLVFLAAAGTTVVAAHN